MSSNAPMVGITAIRGVGTVEFVWVPRPEEVANEIMTLASELENTAGPMMLSREIAIKDHREHFERHESPEGVKWAPWARSYAPRAARTNIGILQRHDLVLESAATNPAAFPVEGDTLFFSTVGLPDYWAPNYFGSSDQGNVGAVDDQRERDIAGGLGIGRGSMGIGSGNALPARPMIGISWKAQLEILEVFEDWFAGTINTIFVRGGKTYGQHRSPGGQFAKKP